MLQDVVDGDDDRAAAKEASDANSADVGKMKFTMLRLTDMTPCRNYFYFGSLLPPLSFFRLFDYFLCFGILFASCKPPPL